MNTKKSLIIVFIGAVVLGAITNASADEIHPDMDTTIGLENTGDSWEDQPFWDDPNVKDGDLIIAPAPDSNDNGEQDEELVILSGATESSDENVVMNSSIPAVGTIAVIGILGTALILIKRKKME